MNPPDLNAATWRKSTRSGANGNCGRRSMPG